MNDRFRFRAFYQGRFIYKSLTDANYYDKNNKCIGLANTLPNNLDWEQCTGFKDKKGNLLFEGDICYDDWFDDKGEILFEDGKFKFDVCDSVFELCDSLPLELHGNIYETPYLLKRLKNETLDKN